MTRRLGGGGYANRHSTATPADHLGDTRRRADERTGREGERVDLLYGEGRPCLRYIGGLEGVVTIGGGIMQHRSRGRAEVHGHVE